MKKKYKKTIAFLQDRYDIALLKYILWDATGSRNNDCY